MAYRKRLRFSICRAAGQQRGIRFKSLSASLEIFMKFDQKILILWHVDAFFRQIGKCSRYKRHMPGKSGHYVINIVRNDQTRVCRFRPLLPKSITF